MEVERILFEEITEAIYEKEAEVRARIAANQMNTIPERYRKEVWEKIIRHLEKEKM